MKTSLYLIVLLTMLSGNVTAAPVYSMLHNPDAYGNTAPDLIDSISQSTPIDYDFLRQTTYFTGANEGEVFANVNAGSIGISAGAFNNGGNAPQRQEVTGTFTFDVIFGSSGSTPIDVIMNLNLSGNINKSNPSFIYSGVQVVAGAIGTGQPASSGYYGEVINDGSESPNRSDMLEGFSATGNSQSVSTNAYTVPVNVPVTMFIELKTIQAYDNSTISFGNTLSLATSGDVFSILDGGDITVNSLDAGIINNSFAAVPVPAAAWLFASGLLGLFMVARRCAN